MSNVVIMIDAQNLIVIFFFTRTCNRLPSDDNNMTCWFHIKNTFYLQTFLWWFTRCNIHWQWTCAFLNAFVFLPKNFYEWNVYLIISALLSRNSLTGYSVQIRRVLYASHILRLNIRHTKTIIHTLEIHSTSVY